MMKLLNQDAMIIQNVIFIVKVRFLKIQVFLERKIAKSTQIHLFLKWVDWRVDLSLQSWTQFKI